MDVARMEVQQTESDTFWQIGNSDIGNIIYSQSETEIPVRLSPGKYIVRYVHPTSGQVNTLHSSLRIKGLYLLRVGEGQEGIYWFHKQQ